MALMTTRRFFLQAVGAGTAAGPLLLGTENKSGSKRPILGEGAHRYEAIHDWGALPAEIKYGNTHGVVEDSQGNIYVHHTVNAASESADTMVVFDAEGKFIKSWGKEFKGGAHGLHIRKEGGTEYLYLCDTKQALVTKRTLNGEEVWTIGYPDQAEQYKPGADGKKQKYSPTNVAIAPNGDIYVGDGYGSSYINVYDNKGGYKFTFGGKGAEPGKMDCPHGLWIDTRGKTPVLVVADRGNNRLQLFDLAGKHLAFSGGVNRPCHFNEHNGMVVVPDLGARVTLLDRNNKVITHLGDDSLLNMWSTVRKQPRDTFTPGKFVCPHGACFDHNGNIFVVEWVEVGRVTKLRKLA